MKEIQLTRNMTALVDDEDYTRLAKFTWSAMPCPNNKWRAARTQKSSQKTIYMHRVILKNKYGFVDHIDGNPLNNQKSNLRLATSAQNNQNRAPNKGTKSGFKGVYFKQNRAHWFSMICYEGKRIYLGCFSDPIEAAKAYNNAAVKYFREFANLNDLKGLE